MGGLGIQEFILTIVIILLFIGAKKIPAMMENASKRHERI